jgi:hypothetical protein
MSGNRSNFFSGDFADPLGGVLAFLFWLQRPEESEVSMANFRPLTDGETKVALKLRTRNKITGVGSTTLKSARVRYGEQDNFTVAVLKVGKSVYTGVAKRNPDDALDPRIGETIALSRALRQGYGART